MGKILCVDYGTKRIGIAITDETNTFARALTVLKNIDFESTVSKIFNLVVENKVKSIVFGMTKNKDGELTLVSEEAKSVGEKIRALSEIYVIFYEEAMSTREAEDILRSMGKTRKKYKDKIDMFAAEIILQSYLAKIKD